MTKEIPLTQGKVALVDAEDYEKLSDFKWSYDGRYARRTDKENKKVYMHRVILEAGKGEIVDHINRNKLDNRKSNLRKASYQQNSSNSKLHRHNTSGYRGVYRWKNYWRAAVTYEGKQISCGYYETKEEAAQAYNEKARELFGEFAYVNKVEKDKERVS